MKLWGARFEKEADKRLNDFNSSINIDSRMYEEDIDGSTAHAQMLCAQGIISEKDLDDIVKNLSDIKNEIANGTLIIDENAEDIHMFIEEELTKRCGDAGKRLHTARSRNDQVALDTRMYTIKRLGSIKDLLKDFIKILCNKAQKHIYSIMPGYTHLQPAQPITFAHHLMAYVQMFIRDISRLDDAQKRCSVMPLGSGALAATTHNIDREFVKERLGFLQISQNSLDGVSDRDFVIEAASALSIIIVHLSRFSEEIILWSSREFNFIELDDAFATGSSIMPQKKNPDICELIRGKSGRVFGNLQGLLCMMKGLPLAYNKDMQEDKEALFDCFDTVCACLKAAAPMLESMKVLEDNMNSAAAEGFINATDCADYLVKKGIPFREAYRIVGQLVKYCIKNSKVLETLDIDEYKAASPYFEADIYKAVSLIECINNRNVTGGPAPDEVKRQIDFAISCCQSF